MLQKYTIVVRKLFLMKPVNLNKTKKMEDILMKNHAKCLSLYLLHQPRTEKINIIMKLPQTSNFSPFTSCFKKVLKLSNYLFLVTLSLPCELKSLLA